MSLIEDFRSLNFSGIVLAPRFVQVLMLETLKLIFMVNDKDKLADKLEADEKEEIETAVKEAMNNQSAKKEDYEKKLKEVEATCNPIITTVYQRSGGAPGGVADGGDEDDSNDEL
uniref:Uncharacterized protein n=1 Tax=Salix viminalis TaxID=40686 RepID=A0A6N2KBK3_SALVM